MKILIYGAGIVGCTYGWQLAENGNKITVLVRKGKKELIDKNGIHIQCHDFRGKGKKIIDAVFRPQVIEELSSKNDFDYIIIATNNIQLKEVLPDLAKNSGKANIMFFQNNWNYFDEIAEQLPVEKYFFGFPFMVGGGIDRECIHCAISGSKFSNTLLGELNGTVTPRIEKMAEALNKAQLKPLISQQIHTWLITHYAVAGGLSAGILNAGSATSFTSNRSMIKETIKSIRESLEVCKKRGIDPKSEKSNKFYYIPLFISAPLAQKIYSNEALSFMFDGHINHSPKEIIKMVEDIIYDGERYNVDMPHLRKLYNGITKS
jgi:ketopantoate reductase